MPPKVKEQAEVQVFNLDNLNPALLPELITFKEIQMKVVKENPFIAITDTASRDLAKKYRTARVSARTSLQGQDKLISSKFNEAKSKTKGYIAELIAYTLPGEIDQQKEIDRDEAVAEEKRQEKARVERQRVETIKTTIDDYVSQWKTSFNLMTFESIESVSANFLESYTSFDLTILQEFETLFPTKIEELTHVICEKTVSLTNAENDRIEKIRIKEEALQLEKRKLEFEAKQKIADEAEAKVKADAAAEREVFEKEKAEFKKQLEEDAAAKAAQAKLESIEIKQMEVLPTEIPTVNVCKSSERESVELAITYSDNEGKKTNLKETQASYTWKTIQHDFKTSGEKSYSKWLENNYNVPTKLI
jgi:hypothetical protein